MRIYVKVIPRSSKNEINPVKCAESVPAAQVFNRVNKTYEGNYVVKLTAPPVDNQANEMLIKVLAGYFDIPKSSLKIIGGKTTKTKLIEIL